MSVFKSKLSENIQIGDYIIIADSNFLNTGFYIGRGKTGSFQFFTIWSLVNWLHGKKDSDNSNRKLKLPYKSYINSSHVTRIAKYHPDCLSFEEKEEYEKAIEALKLLKLK